MKCPVCKTEIQDYYTVCPVCNFFGLHRDFVNVEDAILWEQTVLPYYRALWLRNQQPQTPSVNLETKEAVEVFQRYFTNESHKFRITINDGLPDDFISVSQDKTTRAYEATVSSALFNQKLSETSTIFSVPEDVVSKARNWECKFSGIEINTKYLKFGFISGNSGTPQYYYSYGYDSYKVEYDIEDHNVSLYVKSTVNDKREYICSLSIPNSIIRNELIAVLEFMKGGNGFFSEPFDMSINCVDEYAHEELTYDTYFRDTAIKPLAFYAEVSSFNEDDPFGESFKEHGLCKVVLSVRSSGGNQVPRIEELYSDSVQHNLHIDITRILKPNGPLGYHTLTPLRENEHNHDFYLDRKRKILYVGTLEEYMQFKFVDELLMQQVFNYLVILGTYWLMQDTICIEHDASS